MDDLLPRILTAIAPTALPTNKISLVLAPAFANKDVIEKKASALLDGRSHVSTKDIETMAFPVLRHRIILNFEAERKGLTPDDAVREIIKKAK